MAQKDDMSIVEIISGSDKNPLKTNEMSFEDRPEEHWLNIFKILTSKKLYKQDLIFLNLIFEGEDPGRAFRNAYVPVQHHADIAPLLLERKAYSILENPLFKNYLNQMRSILMKRSITSAETLIDELEEARQIAKEQLSPGPMILATMGKAKILGIDKPVAERNNLLEGKEKQKTIEIKFIKANTSE